jgi:hypothetical protein
MLPNSNTFYSDETRSIFIDNKLNAIFKYNVKKHLKWVPFFAYKKGQIIAYWIV